MNRRDHILIAEVAVALAVAVAVLAAARLGTSAWPLIAAIVGGTLLLWLAVFVAVGIGYATVCEIRHRYQRPARSTVSGKQMRRRSDGRTRASRPDPTPDAADEADTVPMDGDDWNEFLVAYERERVVHHASGQVAS